MSWKENYKKSFNIIYELVKSKGYNIKYPCYGGRFYWVFPSRHTEYLYFYLTDKSLLYTASSTYITEVPFKDIRKLSIKRNSLVKSMFHIRFVTDKKYHLYIYCKEYLSTTLTGSAVDNAKNFIAVLQSSVNTG